jgi:two-component system OmpR family response regulator
MRILVIDDDAAVGLIVKQTLEASGAQVHYCGSALAGLAALEDQLFDLAIVDLVMPGIGGLETIGRLRQINRALPIIAMSGSFDSRAQTPAADFLRLEASNLASVHTLAKPFRPDDLARVVKASLGRPMPGPRSAEQESGG